MAKPSSEYYSSQAEAARAHDMNERTMGGILRAGSFKRSKHGLHKAKVAELVEAHKMKQVRGDGSLRDEKLKREIYKLDIEIGKMRDQLKPIEEWLAEVQELTAIVKVGLEQWVQRIAAEKKDPDIYRWALDCRSDILNRLAERVKDAEDEHGRGVGRVEQAATSA